GRPNRCRANARSFHPETPPTGYAAIEDSTSPWGRGRSDVGFRERSYGAPRRGRRRRHPWNRDLSDGAPASRAWLWYCPRENRSCDQRRYYLCFDPNIAGRDFRIPRLPTPLIEILGR